MKIIWQVIATAATIIAGRCTQPASVDSAATDPQERIAARPRRQMLARWNQPSVPSICSKIPRGVRGA